MGYTFRFFLRALVFVFSVEHVGQRIDRDDVGHLSIEGRALRERHTARDDISQFLLNGRNNSWISRLDSSTRVQRTSAGRPNPQVRPPSRSSDTSGLSVILRWGRFLALRNHRARAPALFALHVAHDVGAY